MATKAPEIISEPNLSRARARAFLNVAGRSKQDLAPLTLSITGFTNSSPEEDPRIRRVLDRTLAHHGICTSAISALTIFPYKHWTRQRYPGFQALSYWYLDDFLPRLKARDPANRNGTYFERMISFSGVKRANGRDEMFHKNQLEHIINDWRRPRQHPKRPRRSALQVACFDPVKDHTGQSVRGFPCLQQVSFVYDDNGNLAVNAYYATQYVFERAYGNYLGLCHLGHFMAHELRLQLARLNCFVGRPELGDFSKTALRPLEKELRRMLMTH